MAWYIKFFFRTGQLVGVGSNDGQIQIWDIKRTVAPKKKIFNAHLNAHDITSVQFSYDNTLIASRSTDGFVKIWDLRNIKTPLNTRNRFNSYRDYFEINICINEIQEVIYR